MWLLVQGPIKALHSKRCYIKQWQFVIKISTKDDVSGKIKVNCSQMGTTGEFPDVHRLHLILIFLLLLSLQFVLLPACNLFYATAVAAAVPPSLFLLMFRLLSQSLNNICCFPSCSITTMIKKWEQPFKRSFPTGFFFLKRETFHYFFFA